MCRVCSIYIRGEFRLTVIWQHPADFKRTLGEIVSQIREVCSCTMPCACVTWCHVQYLLSCLMFPFIQRPGIALRRDSFAPALEIHQKSRSYRESTRENSVQSENRNVEIMKWFVYAQADTLRYGALQINRFTQPRIVINTPLLQPENCDSNDKMWILIAQIDWNVR